MGREAWGHTGTKGKGGQSHLSTRRGSEVRNVKTEGHKQARKGPGSGMGLFGDKKPLHLGKQETNSEWLRGG